MPQIEIWGLTGRDGGSIIPMLKRRNLLSSDVFSPQPIKGPLEVHLQGAPGFRLGSPPPKVVMPVEPSADVVGYYTRCD